MVLQLNFTFVSVEVKLLIGGMSEVDSANFSDKRAKSYNAYGVFFEQIDLCARIEAATPTMNDTTTNDFLISSS